MRTSPMQGLHFSLISSPTETAPPFAVYTFQSQINVNFHTSRNMNKTRTIVNFEVGRRHGRCCSKLPLIHYNYTMNSSPIQEIKCHPHLGMFMSCDLKWRNHLMFIYIFPCLQNFRSHPVLLLLRIAYLC